MTYLDFRTINFIYIYIYKRLYESIADFFKSYRDRTFPLKNYVHKSHCRLIYRSSTIELHEFHTSKIHQLQ